MPRLNRSLIELSVPKKLPRPVTPQDSVECLHVIRTLERMEIEICRLLLFCQRPAAFIRYSGGKAPERFWAKWLWGKIVPESSEYSWLGRLAAINQFERELIFIPRPDMIDESLAKSAHERSTDGQCIHLMLGTIYVPHQFRRNFSLLH